MKFLEEIIKLYLRFIKRLELKLFFNFSIIAYIIYTTQKIKTWIINCKSW